MLKLVYDIKCGFDDLYVVAKHQTTDVSYVAEDDSSLDNVDFNDMLFVPSANDKSEVALYEKYKNNVEAFVADFELEESLRNAEANYYAHKFFSDICFAEGCEHYLPDIFEMSNFNIIYIPSDIEADLEAEEEEGF